MRRGMLSKASIFFIVAALASCAGSVPPAQEKTPSYSALKLEELTSMAVSDPERAIEAVSTLSYSKSLSLSGEAPTSLSSSELSAVAELSLGILKKKFDDSFNAGKWLEASRYFESLVAIKSPGFLAFLPENAASDVSKEAASRTTASIRFDIYFGLAEGFKKKGYYAPSMQCYKNALSSFAADGGSRALDKKAFGTLASYADWARSEGDASTVNYLGRLAIPTGQVRLANPAKPTSASNPSSMEQANPDGLPPAGTAKPSIASMVSGVVTVYVDKGLKMEGAYGVPDRVLGTAFQIDASGLYLTNYHVIQSEVDPSYKGYSRLSIRPSATPEARIPAKVVGWDKDLDLALIQSSEKASYTFNLSDQNAVANGETVYAIGSPVGLENSVSSGIISATGRHFLSLGDAIQIDVPVNPGNSGSPLVNKNGDLSGIVFAGLPNFQGINFALSAAWIKEDVPMLFQGGEVRHSWLGVLLTKTIDGELKVVYCYPGTKDAFKPGDTVVSVDSLAAKDIQSLQSYLAFKPPESLCSIEIKRNGSILRVLRRVLPDFQSSFEKAIRLDDAENIMQGAGGMLVENISEPRGPGGIYRVVEAWPGMAADESGIQPGDIFKFLGISVDKAAQAIYIDVSVKSRMSGYLERTLRIAVPLAATNFI